MNVTYSAEETMKMRRVLVLGVGALLALAAFPFAQTLGNNTLLFHSEDAVRWTQCAFGPDGKLWSSGSPGHKRGQRRPRLGRFL